MICLPPPKKSRAAPARNCRKGSGSVLVTLSRVQDRARNALPQGANDPVQILAGDDGEDHNHILDYSVDGPIVSDPEPEGGHLEANQSLALWRARKGVLAEGLKFVEDFQTEIGRKFRKLGLGRPSDLDAQGSSPRP